MKVRKSGRLAYVGSQYMEYDYKASEEVIPFGAGVMRGTNKETQCKTMVAGGAFLGVAKAYQKNTFDEPEYAEKISIEIITRGKVWVEVSTNVIAGDKASCGNGGRFAKSGTANFDDINGEFETSATNGEYAILILK
ncbi:MAG: structural cement protein Gp24 [Paraclostridium sp.]